MVKKQSAPIEDQPEPQDNLTRAVEAGKLLIAQLTSAMPDLNSLEAFELAFYQATQQEQFDGAYADFMATVAALRSFPPPDDDTLLVIITDLATLFDTMATAAACWLSVKLHVLKHRPK